MSSKVSKPGIECPRCGYGSSVAKTVNYVSWMARMRVCKNTRCRHVFETTETINDDERKDLFNG